MSYTDELLNSLLPIKETQKAYFNELNQLYSSYKNFDNLPFDDYLSKIFDSTQRSYFTICSKESFNNLESEKHWQNSIIFTPLNDHSRPFMKKGDIVFCYRQGQFADLKTALNERGIYAIGFVASEPKKLFSQYKDHNAYGVAILFPLSLIHHLELRNIQLNPITISLTPYNGNRNDALQYIPEKEYYETLIKLICKKNPNTKIALERIINKKISEIKLPDEIWNHNIKNNNSLYSQIIYYGVPGSGKSHKIDEQTNNLPQDQKIRVVFHPEYTNADFVGQVMPSISQTENKVDYKFIPGPFAKILRRAYLNPEKSYCLIIEEINRGNAAAIFGDLFQLLDRLDDDKDGYTKGWSSYSINNDFINWYIRENLYAEEKEKLINENNGAAEKDDESQKSIKINEFHFSANTGIRLPPNLSLLATMNTSDQNVFTLDNAFQRRWDMELVENEFHHKDETEIEKQNADNQMYATIVVNKKCITWQNFQSQINSIIGDKGNESGLSSMEDKRLGCWFVKAEDGKINKDVFANKVLKYLWDDAFKFCRDDIFTGKIKNFEELQKQFDEIGFDIFAPACNLKLAVASSKDASIQSSTVTQESSLKEPSVASQPELGV